MAYHIFKIGRNYKKQFLDPMIKVQQNKYKKTFFSHSQIITIVSMTIEKSGAYVKVFLFLELSFNK